MTDPREVLKTKRFILASASPRRAELLRQVGLTFEIREGQVPEGNAPPDPVAHVTELSRRKAEQVAKDLAEGIVIGADTIVVLDGKILGKPKDLDEARQMLSLLSGKTHQVYTGFTLIEKPSGQSITDYEVTQVTFRSLSPWEIEDYVDTEKPVDKAGAYGIQDKSALFAERIEGCYYNIVGFPLAKFYQRVLSLISAENAMVPQSRHVGEELRAERERKQIRLEDIAQKTRIQIKFLRAIEEGDFNFLPAPYVKAFIKAYASEVGLDGQALWAKREQEQEALRRAAEAAQRPPKKVKPVEVTEPIIEEGQAPLSARLRWIATHKSELALTLLGVAVIGLIIFVYARYGGEVFREAPKNVVEIPVRQYAIQPDTTEPAQAAELKPLVLQLVGLGRTWVQVTADDSTTSGFILLPGEQRTWQARRGFSVRLGNAAGVQVILNDKTLPPVGTGGEVVNLVLNRNGVVERTTYRPPPRTETPPAPAPGDTARR